MDDKNRIEVPQRETILAAPIGTNILVLKHFDSDLDENGHFKNKTISYLEDGLARHKQHGDEPDSAGRLKSESVGFFEDRTALEKSWDEADKLFDVRRSNYLSFGRVVASMRQSQVITTPKEKPNDAEE